MAKTTAGVLFERLMDWGIARREAGRWPLERRHQHGDFFMRWNAWMRATALACSLALTTLSGCMTKVNEPGGTDNGPGSGATGGVSTGADTDPRRGSAATSPERTGPN